MKYGNCTYSNGADALFRTYKVIKHTCTAGAVDNYPISVFNYQRSFFLPVFPCNIEMLEEDKDGGKLLQFTHDCHSTVENPNTIS